MEKPEIIRISPAATKSCHAAVAFIDRDLVQRKADDARRSPRKREIHVFHSGDEGCSESDWLRFNLQLWRFTGETRFLDMAERLLLNQYAANQCPNGGYGWRNFDGDAAERYGILRRCLQKFCVEACNANDWVIPLPQITVHAAEQPQSEKKI